MDGVRPLQNNDGDDDDLDSAIAASLADLDRLPASPDPTPQPERAEGSEGRDVEKLPLEQRPQAVQTCVQMGFPRDRVERA